MDQLTKDKNATYAKALDEIKDRTTFSATDPNLGGAGSATAIGDEPMWWKGDDGVWVQTKLTAKGVKQNLTKTFQDVGLGETTRERGR